ncbi:MAG: Gfo/Idh/MocA family oxidoreductase, partial [Lachnospiraceae bacterium]|nr:Gfo/Idh/MocA family oxidoreductase [Lachnospiraceae bacterium]
QDYCEVVYLERTEGISSTDIRSEKNRLRIGLVGETETELTSLDKFLKEVKYVNGIEVVCANSRTRSLPVIDDYQLLLQKVDAVYITSHPAKHYKQVKAALLEKKHVLCESPITLSKKETKELLGLADKNKCILMEGAKTAYTTAYERLILLAKTGKIGNVLSVDATCTSMKRLSNYKKADLENNWNTITEWGPPALLPVFQILGPGYKDKHILTRYLNKELNYDGFTKIDFVYEGAVASVKLAKGAKSEGELIITGTKGYIYVPAPWWKTDYFEVRYENPMNNKRYFYQLDGEGIRYEILAFVRMVESGKNAPEIGKSLSLAISYIMEAYYRGDVTELT